MKIVGLNVLLYTVNENAVHHTPLLKWWEEAIDGDEPLGLPWIVFLGFLRIFTNPRIFPQPAEREGISLDQFIATAVGEKTTVLMTKSYSRTHSPSFGRKAAAVSDALWCMTTTRH